MLLSPYNKLETLDHLRAHWPLPIRPQSAPAGGRATLQWHGQQATAYVRAQFVRSGLLFSVEEAWAIEGVWVPQAEQDAASENATLARALWVPGPHLKGGYTMTGVRTVDPMAAFYKRHILQASKAARGFGEEGKGK